MGELWSKIVDMNQYFHTLFYTFFNPHFLQATILNNFPMICHIFVTYGSCNETSNVWKMWGNSRVQAWKNIPNVVMKVAKQGWIIGGNSELVV